MFHLVSNDLFSFLIVLLFASIVFYHISFLRNKEIWHLSLLQIILLIIVPGFLFVIFYSYIQSIIELPRVHTPVFPDGVLVSVTLLAMLFGYGGIAIHAVTKMLAEILRHSEDSQVAQLNKYFHLNFSHNLIYSSGLLVIVGLTLLELNHVPQKGYEGYVAPIVRGIIVGLFWVYGMYQYTRSKDQYVGRWADLKAVFIILWLCFVILMYGIWKVNSSWKEYQLLIPVLSLILLTIVFNAGLILRRIRRQRKQFLDYFEHEREDTVKI